MHTPDHPAPTSEKDLDKALQATFPASDPLSATSQFTATPTSDHIHAADTAAHPGTLTVYRVVDESQKDKPFGASGGSDSRWTSAGTEAVYGSTSPAAALLEFLAHCEGAPPETAFLARAQLPTDRVTSLQAYPSDWQARPYRADVQRVGDEWAGSHRSLAAQVPSAIAADTHNIIINPAHVDAPLIQGVHVEPIRIDDRLRRVAGA